MHCKSSSEDSSFFFQFSFSAPSTPKYLHLLTQPQNLLSVSSKWCGINHLQMPELQDGGNISSHRRLKLWPHFHQHGQRFTHEQLVSSVFCVVGIPNSTAVLGARSSGIKQFCALQMRWSPWAILKLFNYVDKENSILT